MRKPENGVSEEKMFEQIIQEFGTINVPEIKDEIKAKYYYHQKKSIRNEKSRYLLPKKIAFTVLSLLSVIIITLILFQVNVSPSPYKFESDEDILTFEAISAVSIMPTDSQNLLSTSREQSRLIPLAQYENTDYIDNINRYIFMVEQILSLNDGLKITRDAISDRPEYSTMEIIEVTSPLGQTSTFTLYYNSLSDKKEGGEEKNEYVGVMVFNDRDYQLQGSKKTEGNEVKVALVAAYDDNTWVEVNQKFENNEEKYTYTIFDNGSKSETKIKIEGREKLKVKLEYETENNRGTYLFTQDEQNQIKVQVKENDDQEIFIVKVTTINGVVMYEYQSNGKTERRINQYKKDKDDKDDDKEEKEK